ncbi:MAG: hypothetical protein J0H68_03710 [Sphingobacteriia bacterium]|nr:hypothetical protein [Sphingobacteriia bacterium]
MALEKVTTKEKITAKVKEIKEELKDSADKIKNSITRSKSSSSIKKISKINAKEDKEIPIEKNVTSEAPLSASPTSPRKESAEKEKKSSSPLNLFKRIRAASNASNKTPLSPREDSPTSPRKASSVVKYEERNFTDKFIELTANFYLSNLELIVNKCAEDSLNLEKSKILDWKYVIEQVIEANKTRIALVFYPNKSKTLKYSSPAVMAGFNWLSLVCNLYSFYQAIENLPNSKYYNCKVQGSLNNNNGYIDETKVQDFKTAVLNNPTELISNINLIINNLHQLVVQLKRLKNEKKVTEENFKSSIESITKLYNLFTEISSDKEFLENLKTKIAFLPEFLEETKSASSNNIISSPSSERRFRANYEASKGTPLSEKLVSAKK